MSQLSPCQGFRKGSALRPVYADQNGNIEPNMNIWGLKDAVTAAAGGSCTTRYLRGQITLSATQAASSGNTITVANGNVTATSQIFLDVIQSTTTAATSEIPATVQLGARSAGSFTVLYRNTDAAATEAAPIILFSILP